MRSCVLSVASTSTLRRSLVSGRRRTSPRASSLSISAVTAAGVRAVSKLRGCRSNWFNSYSGRASEHGKIADLAGYAKDIRALHVDDPSPNAEILQHVDRLDRSYPVYDMPKLPCWHKGGLCRSETPRTQSVRMPDRVPPWQLKTRWSSPHLSRQNTAVLRRSDVSKSSAASASTRLSSSPPVTTPRSARA